MPDEVNPKGFFENLDFKRLMIKHAGRLAQSGELAKPSSEFEKAVKEYVPEEGKWIAKFSAMYWPMWVSFDPVWICVRRQRGGIIASNMKTNFMNSQDLKKINYLIDRHSVAMDSVDGIDVKTDDVAAGEFSTIQRAIEGAGLEFDESVTREFVSPDLWNRHLDL